MASKPRRWRRAVIGGLAAATLATLFVLPTVFAIVQGGAGRRSASIDPADPESPRTTNQSSGAMAHSPPYRQTVNRSSRGSR